MADFHPHELARDAREPAARREAERLQGEADAALTEAGALKLLSRLEDLTVEFREKLEDGKVQAEPHGLEDLHLLDGLLARGRQDAGVAGSSRKMDADVIENCFSISYSTPDSVATFLFAI